MSLAWIKEECGGVTTLRKKLRIGFATSSSKDIQAYIFVISKYRQGDMAKGVKNDKELWQYWESEAKLGPDRSVIDQNDKKGAKQNI
jgi:hypothetical protein